MAESLLFGVLGGMGPQATLDLMQKLLDRMPAERDQQHLPVVCWNVPQIPDRQLALAGRGESPLPQMLAGIRQLNQLAVSHILLPCNTAHSWYAELAAASQARLLHLVDITTDYIGRLQPRPVSVGIIATAGTLQAQWYQQRLAALGIVSVVPTAAELDGLFVPGCYAVKRGQPQQAGVLLAQLAEALLSRGAQQLILACTEVPVALQAIGSPLISLSIDPSVVLADYCVALWQAQCEGMQSVG